LMSITRLKLI